MEIKIAMSGKLGSNSISVTFGIGRKPKLMFLMDNVDIYSFIDTTFFFILVKSNGSYTFLQLSKYNSTCGAVSDFHGLSLAPGFRRFDDF